MRRGRSSRRAWAGPGAAPAPADRAAGLGRGPSLPQRPLRPRPEPPDASGRSPSLCPPGQARRAGAGGRPAGSLTGPWRAAQRSGQAAGAPPAALQQHGGHGGARWTGGRLRPRSCPAARAAAIPTRPAAPGSCVCPAPPRRAEHAGSRSPGAHGESGGGAGRWGWRHRGAGAAAALLHSRPRGAAAVAVGAGGVSVLLSPSVPHSQPTVPAAPGRPQAVPTVNGGRRCLTEPPRAPWLHITPAQSTALQHGTVLSSLAESGLDDAQRSLPGLTSP